jgi:hypothetical protein
VSSEAINQYTGPDRSSRIAPPAPSDALPTMHRRLGPTEAIYYMLDQLYCLNFVVFAEIRGPMDGTALHRALLLAQREHPLLRTRIDLVQGHPCFKAVPMDRAPLKVQAAALRNWRHTMAAQLNTPFDDRAPLARCFWFCDGAEKSVVAMVFHHCIADGKSGTQVLIDVLKRAAGEDPAERLQPAHPSAQDLDLIKHKSVVDSSVQKLKYWLGQGKAALLFAQQIPGYDMGLRSERDIRAIPFLIAKATGQALLTQCRAKGTTVHGALGAAQILALNAEFDAPGARHLALTSLSDLRGVLSTKLTAEDLGLYIATITTVHAVTVEPQFWPLAVDLRNQLARVLSSGDANLVHTIYPQAPLIAPNKRSANWVQSAVSLAPPSSMLTNIGRLDAVKLANGARIRSIAFAVSPPPQHPICVTVATYDDRMHLNLLYDQTKLGAPQARRVVKSLIRLITAAAQGHGGA